MKYSNVFTVFYFVGQCKTKCNRDVSSNIAADIVQRKYNKILNFGLFTTFSFYYEHCLFQTIFEY